ncbi:MAG: ABC transporter substrate-binding protein [Candidatus Izimaplasma sp.]|nr:ABC transporter substrate-binding protein [Candidatus Izimaplasma bacterium]
MKKLLLMVSVLLLTVTLSACGSNDNTVRLGVIGPLTGEYSLYGVAVENGAKLAAKEINAAGGILDKDVEVIAYDSKGDSTEGVNAYNRLRDQDEIHALIGGTFSGVTLAIKDLAVQDNIPVLTPTATNPDVTLDAANVFRACYTDSYQGSTAAVFAADELDVTNAAVMYNRDDPYSEGLADAFMAEFDARSLDYTAFEFGAQDDDYSALLTNIQSGGYDAVFLPAYVAEVGAVLTQADAQGLDVPFIGGDGWDGIEADYASVADGFYFVNHYAKTDEAAVVQDFVANYTEEYGEAPNALAALAYDAVYAMAEAMENAGSLDPDDITAALSALEFTNAVTGSIKFDANGDPIKSITIIQVVDGLHEVYAKVAATEE